MMSDLYLLDTSALLTLIEEEDGYGDVFKILKENEVLIPFIVLLEVYYISYRERGEDVADQRYAFIKSLSRSSHSGERIKIIFEINEPILITAGRLKATYKISLADSIISAYAIINSAILVHKDPEYDSIPDDILRKLRLPYKKVDRK